MTTCNFLNVTGPNIGSKCGRPGMLFIGQKIRCRECIDAVWPEETYTCVRIMKSGPRCGSPCGKNTKFADRFCSYCRRTFPAEIPQSLHSVKETNPVSSNVGEQFQSREFLYMPPYVRNSKEFPLVFKNGFWRTRDNLNQVLHPRVAMLIDTDDTFPVLYKSDFCTEDDAKAVF